MKSEVGPVCRGRIHSGKWCPSGLRRTRVRPSLAYRQNLIIAEDNRAPSTIQSTLSRHQISHAWQCRGVGGSLARGTRDLQADGSQWSFVTQQVQHEPGIPSLDAIRAATTAPTMRRSWHASVLRDRPEPGLWVWECSTDHCWKQRHTTDTLCPTCTAIRRCLSSFLQAYNGTPFKLQNCESRC